jgi:hypothetical protein
LERCFATAEKPITANSASSLRVGMAELDELETVRPIGFSSEMAGGGASCGKGPMAVLPRLRTTIIR